MNYAIYGSCVTRDIFSILEIYDQVSEYSARSSIHSYVTPLISADMIPDLSVISHTISNFHAIFDEIV